MFKALAATLALSGGLATVAVVASPGALEGAKSGHAAKKEDKAAADSDRGMYADNVILPVVRDGKLRNYLFVSVRFELASGGNMFKMLEKGHILRDALLRATHGGNLADSTSDFAINEAATLASFRAAAEGALGAGAVKNVKILSVQSLRRN